MNNFYATVECMLDPSLKGKCIAVGGSVEQRNGIILAKNYEAKAYGVKTGEALWQARQKCPNLIVVPPNYDQYLKFSKLARSIYERYTDQVEPYGMDECFLDVTGSRAFGTGYEIAEEIRKAIKFELGLTVSCGVSYNKIFAKLGSELKKPDAVSVIEKTTFRETIWHLPASELLGVGGATNKKLRKYRIETIGDIAMADESLLKSKFGVHGLKIKQYANGLDNSVVHVADFISPVKSIGHGTTTIQDLENSAEVWCVMLQLVQDIGTKLRKHKKRACGISITIRNTELNIKEWQCKLDRPTQSPTDLAKKAFELFHKSYRWQLPIRSVTVRAISLVEESVPLQTDFFADINTIEKRECLDLAVESIRSRFGKNSITNAILCKNIKVSKNMDTGVIMPTGMIG